MKNKFNFNAVIASVGKSVYSHTADGWYSTPFRALIHPLRYKNKMYLEGVYTDIGRSTSGYYLYIGPSDHDITRLGENGMIVSDDEKYIITRAEKCYLGDDVTHIWAILRSVEGEE